MQRARSSVTSTTAALVAGLLPLAASCGNERQDGGPPPAEVTLPGSSGATAEPAPAPRRDYLREVIEQVDVIFVGVVEGDSGMAPIARYNAKRVQRVDFLGGPESRLILYRVEQVLLGDLEVSHLTSPGAVTSRADGTLDTEVVYPGARLIVAAELGRRGWWSRNGVHLPVVADVDSIERIRTLIAAVRGPTERDDLLIAWLAVLALGVVAAVILWKRGEPARRSAS